MVDMDGLEKVDPDAPEPETEGELDEDFHHVQHNKRKPLSAPGADWNMKEFW